jgi:hypothetical protein
MHKKSFEMRHFLGSPYSGNAGLAVSLAAGVARKG